MSISWNKYIAYYLGFLYADGSIDTYRSSIEIIKEDADIIEPFFLKTKLNFSTYERKRKNRKSQKSFWILDKNFCSLVSEEMNYKNKSTQPPNIDDLPKNLFRYFILGFIDGDGCFYISKNKITKQFYITSSFDYDWSMIKSLFDSMDIKYKISKVVNNKEKNHRSSYIRITKYDSHKKLYNYLYPNGYEIGLRRKYDKATDIIKNKPICEQNRDPLILSEIISDLKTMNYLEISKKYNCGDRKIRRFAKKHKIGTYSIN